VIAGYIESFCPQAKKAPGKSMTSMKQDYALCLMAVLEEPSVVDARDAFGRSSIMLAAAANFETAIELLVAKGADLDLQDVDGNTALHYGYAFSNVRATYILEAHGAIAMRNYLVMPICLTGAWRNNVRFFVL
jgi:hypothetical protein